MTRTAQLAIAAAIAVAALAAGIALRLGAGNQTVSPIPPASAASELMSARLPDVDGRPQALAQWRGKVLVVNFWATWCAPCRQEIPAFIRVQDRWASRGLQVVGIAIDDADKVRPYAAALRINYPILVGGLDGIELARLAGNRLGGLPFTVVFDREGGAVHTQLGGMDEKKLESLVQSLIGAG